MNDRIADRRGHSFFIVDDSVIDKHGAKLGPYGIAIYCAMARMANQSGTLFPSIDTLAKNVGMSRRKAVDVIKLMESIGLIAREKRVTDNGRQTSYLFTLQPVQSSVARDAGTTLHEVQPPLARDAAEVDIPIKKNREEEVSPSATPSTNGSHLDKLMGSSINGARRVHHQLLDDIKGTVTSLGLSMSEFRLLVDHLLETYGKLKIVNAGHADEILSKFQMTIVQLITLDASRYCSAAALDQLIASWKAQAWQAKDGGLPTSKQLVDHAALIDAGQMQWEATGTKASQIPGFVPVKSINA